MTDAGIVQCPSCGASSLVETSAFERRCEYCGTSVELAQSANTPFRCPRCAVENEPGARYCSKCGLALSKWLSAPKTKTDLGIVSIIATVVGTMFVPIGGGILGLILAYKAREQARASRGTGGSAEIARIAIIVGWLGLAFGLLPLCFFPALMGGQMGLSFCGAMTEVPILFTGG